MKQILHKIKFWFKDRVRYILLSGKCPICKNKLHLNQLGFHNCGKCFTKYIAEELGENSEDWLD